MCHELLCCFGQSEPEKRPSGRKEAESSPPKPSAAINGGVQAPSPPNPSAAINGGVLAAPSPSMPSATINGGVLVPSQQNMATINQGKVKTKAMHACNLCLETV